MCILLTWGHVNPLLTIDVERQDELWKNLCHVPKVRRNWTVVGRNEAEPQGSKINKIHLCYLRYIYMIYVS